MASSLSSKRSAPNLKMSLIQVRKLRYLQLVKIKLTDRGQLISGISDIITEKMNAAFQVLELSFAEKVGREMRAELAR